MNHKKLRRFGVVYKNRSRPCGSRARTGTPEDLYLRVAQALIHRVVSGGLESAAAKFEGPGVQSVWLVVDPLDDSRRIWVHTNDCYAGLAPTEPGFTMSCTLDRAHTLVPQMTSFLERSLGDCQDVSFTFREVRKGAELFHTDDRTGTAREGFDPAMRRQPLLVDGV